MSDEGKISLQSSLIPVNRNPRQPVTENQFVAGAAQNFTTLDELVAFHPDLMKQGMSANLVTINSQTQQVVISQYVLIVDPSTLLDDENNSIVTVDNFLNYWAKSNETLTQTNRVFEYAPNGPGGTQPPYPYSSNPAFESNWHGIALPTDKWLRWRDSDDYDTVSGVKIYRGWTVPVSIGPESVSGDYVDNLYLRQDVDPTVRNSTTGLVNGKSYLVIDGTVTESASGVPDVVYTSSRIFTYDSTHTYVFTSAHVQESVPVPPRTVNGVSNDEPTGWSDTPPVGSAQLWNIFGTKSVYGQLKSEWQLRKINENPDLLRYNNLASPDPNGIVGNNTSAAESTPGDTALTTAGWQSTYQPSFNFIAERTATGGSPAYTQWVITRISGESGQYTDRVFKLFDINEDSDTVALNKPTDADAISQGFSDVPLPETDTQINYEFIATKFFDGTLKGSWSDGAPYTSKPIFNDVITADLGNNFKYNPNSATPDVPVPSAITLTAELYKGISKVWETAEVDYVWTRIYNNGAVADTVISSFSNTDPLYLLPDSGTPGDSGYIRNGQRLVVTPAGVTGKAVFQVQQTFVVPGGTNIVFTEQFVITDVTDGLDAKDLSIKADNQLVIFDSGSSSFAPSQVNINAFSNNLGDSTIYWYFWDGAEWVYLNPGDSASSILSHHIVETIYGSKLVLICSEVFPATSDLDEIKIAASTNGMNPESADNITTFSDFTTITKAAAAAVGTPGADALFAILDNENQSVILDSGTGTPDAGEIGPTGKAQTIVSVYDGVNKVPIGAGPDTYSISLASDDADVTFGSNTTGLTSDVRVYVSGWNSPARKAICTITITYDDGTTTRSFNKKFVVGSTLDAPGAIVVTVDSSDGFQFTPDDRSDKTLTTSIYDTSKTPALQDPSNYYFNWTVDGSTDVGWTQGGGSTHGEQKVISRASILVSGEVIVRVSKVAVPGTDDIFRTVTLKMYDITDGKIYRLFNAADVAPSKPISSTGPSGDGTWVPYLSSPKWAVDGSEQPNTNPITYDWTNPYQIGGEKGDQGNSGGFYYEMYQSSGNDPNTAPALGAGGSGSSIAQMTAAGWKSSSPGQLPTSGYVWKTTRLFSTIDSDGNPLSFDSNGYPINAVIYSANSVWLAPQRLTPVPGQNGSGPAGPGYNGVTYVSTDGSGNRLYSLNQVNGAGPASILVPKGDKGDAGLVPGMVKFGYAGALSPVISLGKKMELTSSSSSSVLLYDTGYTDGHYRNYRVTVRAAYSNPQYTALVAIGADPTAYNNVHNPVNEWFGDSRIFINGQSGQYILEFTLNITTPYRYIVGGFSGDPRSVLAWMQLDVFEIQ